ncbi:hypothetical protein VSS24_04825 [Streptomyces nigra]
MPAAAERAAGRGQPGRRQEAGRAAKAARSRAVRGGLDEVGKVLSLGLRLLGLLGSVLVEKTEEELDRGYACCFGVPLDLDRPPQSAVVGATLLEPLFEWASVASAPEGEVVLVDAVDFHSDSVADQDRVQVLQRAVAHPHARALPYLV